MCFQLKKEVWMELAARYGFKCFKTMYILSVKNIKMIWYQSITTHMHTRFISAMFKMKNEKLAFT
jgi:hypothetical protein